MQLRRLARRRGEPSPAFGSLYEGLPADDVRMVAPPLPHALDSLLESRPATRLKSRLNFHTSGEKAPVGGADEAKNRSQVGEKRPICTTRGPRGYPCGPGYPSGPRVSVRSRCPSGPCLAFG